MRDVKHQISNQVALEVTRSFTVPLESSCHKEYTDEICLFWVARAIFQQSGDCHHCRWQGCKFRPMLSTTAYSSEGSLSCHTYCDTGPPFLRSYPKDPWFYLLNAVLLAKEQSLPILNVLGLTRPVRAGLQLTTYRLLSESTTTRLRPHLIASYGTRGDVEDLF